MKVFLDTIGCRLNQSEIERIATRFQSAGHSIVGLASDADLVVINTCSVTGQAASDSRAAVRRAARSSQGKIIVTGCWSTLEPEAAAGLPGVFKVLPNDLKEHLIEEIEDILPDPQVEFPHARQMLPNHPRTRAFIKVQDGCENFCTFCVTRIARGHSLSQPMDEVIDEIKNALNSGVKEVVLTGVNLGSWGRDFHSRLNFQALVEAILSRTSIRRLRFSSLEPWDLEDSFFHLLQDGRLCRHLHLPLQSGSSNVLKRMARKITPDSFASLLENIRRVSPNIAVTTDILVGFPGEDEKEFEEGLNFVKMMQFSGGHVFNFSARPGTPAANYPDYVPALVRKERSARMRTILDDSSTAYQKKFIGQTLDVLWEASGRLTSEGWILDGLTDNYLRVKAAASHSRWNQVDPVLIEKLAPAGLWGTIV